MLTRFPGRHPRQIVLSARRAGVRAGVDSPRSVVERRRRTRGALLHRRRCGVAAIPDQPRHDSDSHVAQPRRAILAHPDWCVLDLDPKDAPFASVIASHARSATLPLELELPAYLKTSGASGLHVLIPTGEPADARSGRAPSRTCWRASSSIVCRDIATIARVGATPRAEGVHRLSAERPRSSARGAVQRARRTDRRRFDAAALGRADRVA